MIGVRTMSTNRDRESIPRAGSIRKEEGVSHADT
jgi:hypothetical protein